MIDNTIDDYHETRKRPQRIGVDMDNGLVSSGVCVHLTHTKKKRKIKGKPTEFLQQVWCLDCRGGRRTRQHMFALTVEMRRVN